MKEKLHTVVYTNTAPPPGNYSQGRMIDLGNCYALYTCGQTGDDPKTGQVVEGGIAEQTTQALENIKSIVGAAGGTLDDIVKITVFMKNMDSNKKSFEEVYLRYFPKDLSTPKPARSLVEVSEIPLPGDPAIIEIEAIAYISKKS